MRWKYNRLFEQVTLSLLLWCKIWAATTKKTKKKHHANCKNKMQMTKNSFKGGYSVLTIVNSFA